MKMRKYLVLLVVVTLAVSLLAIPASAASGTLDPMGWTTEAGNADQQKGWEMTADEAKNIKVITIEFNADSPIAADMRFDFVNNFGGWNEFQYKITQADVDAKKITIDLTKEAKYAYDKIAEDGQLVLAFWDPSWVGAKVKSISYSDGAAAAETPAAPAGNETAAPAANNPKTGVETYIFVALGALALAAAGAVVFARKANKA